MQSRAEAWICERLRPAAAGVQARGTGTFPAGLTAGAVAATARWHRIHLVLAAACGTSPADRAIREALADDVRRAVLQGAVREDECRRMVRACADAGVDLLIFKGAALAWSVYGLAWTRPFADVDVLVAEAQVATVRKVLASIGYAQVAQVDGALITRQAAFVREGRAGERHQIDVHWRLFNPEPVGALFTCEELMARAEALGPLDAAARRPANVDALVIAAVHRAAHHNDADDLIWIWDIDRLARRLSGGNWRTLVATARARGVGGLCAAGLARAAACFATPIPDGVRRTLEDGGTAERSAVFLGGRLGELDIQIHNLAHLRWRERGAFLAQHLFPSPAYMRRKYARRRLPLPLLYAWRIAAGAPRWLARR